METWRLLVAGSALQPYTSIRKISDIRLEWIQGKNSTYNYISNLIFGVASCNLAPKDINARYLLKVKNYTIKLTNLCGVTSSGTGLYFARLSADIL